ncbi:MAG: hypothetical protein HYV09_04125 [Deltaproteobacteria bacterium]|nr:hypothetical protein [Deltaproteobacteria bacterium]
MKHVLFAEFPDQPTAEAAIRDLADEGIRESRYRVELQAGPHAGGEDDRPLSHTDARSGVAIGIILAAIVGGVMGWLVTGPLGLFAVGTWTGVLTGVVLGLAIGFTGGLISGSMNPDRKLQGLERVAAREGGVVATVEVDGQHEEESVERVFAARGARIARRVV